MLKLIQKFGAPAIVCFLFLAPILVTSNFYLHVMIMMCINVIMATSMWLLATTGLLSFGQAGFMFIGAMTSALLVKNLGWPFWVCIPLAGIIPALVALAVGRVCIHIKGAQFFMVTMAFGELIRGIFAYFRNPFGGWYGIINIPPPEPHRYFTPLNKVGFYYLGDHAYGDHLLGGLPGKPLAHRDDLLEPERVGDARRFYRGQRKEAQTSCLSVRGLFRRHSRHVLCPLSVVHKPAGLYRADVPQCADFRRGGRHVELRRPDPRRSNPHIGPGVFPGHRGIPNVDLRRDSRFCRALHAQGNRWECWKKRFFPCC